jgi:hypothetical protein
MSTPESKVQTRVKEILKRHNTYTFMPPMNGYGRSGVPDIVACIDGKFIAVECKADGNKPTKLQLKTLHEIANASGYAFVVDASSVGVFAITLSEILASKNRLVGPGGTFYDFTDMVASDVLAKMAGIP